MSGAVPAYEASSWDRVLDRVLLDVLLGGRVLLLEGDVLLPSVSI